MPDTVANQVTVMISRFPYGWYPYAQIEHPDITDYLMTTYHEMRTDPRIERVRRSRKADTPIPMTRNEAVETARQNKVDFLLMIDSDVSPDLHLSGKEQAGSPYPEYWTDWAKPFWSTSFDFAIEQRAAGSPCIIGAPYCGPSPHQNVYVFRWDNWRNNYTPDANDMKLDQYPRAEAATLTGIQEVAALPTGLILIDMQAIEKATPPYFYYEYTDERELHKASTEDVTFTRDMSLYGVKQYCNWDAWCGHHKHELVAKPAPLTSANIGDRMREAMRREVRKEFNLNAPNEQLVMVGSRATPQQRKALALEMQGLSIEPMTNGNGKQQTQYDPDRGECVQARW